MTPKSTLLSSESLTELTANRRPPCLSLYQPTHRTHPENKQDPIRFGNLIKELDASLRQAYPMVDARPLLEPFEALAHDQDFWNHTLDGLAVLSAKGIFRVFTLMRPVAELTVVADSFHTKPLMRILQSADRYHVLGINRQEVRLFEGNRNALGEIELAQGIPRTMTEALGDELTEPHSTVASYGGVGQGSVPMHHGHGGKESEVDLDTERFFRVVDRGVLQHHSQPSGLPLILASLPEHYRVFHEVSHNPFLVENHIDVHPDALSSLDELRNRAWQLLEPRYQSRLVELGKEFEQARSKGLGHDDLKQVAQAAATGRVATLLIEADRQITGRLHRATGHVEFADQSHPQGDDLLDDLGELVETMGGQVLVIPAERMTTRTGLAAIYRY